MLKRIEKILKIEGYMVFCEWNSGEERRINFAKVVEFYPQKLKEKILDFDTLSTIKINSDAKTLYIPNILRTGGGDIDFCPDILYSKSEFVN